LDFPQDGIYETTGPGAGALLGEFHGLEEHGVGRNALEAKQFVGRAPQDRGEGGLHPCGVDPRIGVKDTLEKPLGAYGAQGHLREKGCVAAVEVFCETAALYLVARVDVGVSGSLDDKGNNPPYFRTVVR